MTDPCTCRRLPKDLQGRYRCNHCYDLLVRENRMLRHDMHDLELIAVSRRVDIEKLLAKPAKGRRKPAV